MVKGHVMGMVCRASPYDLRGVGNGCGPVKALPERVTYKGAGHRVMAAGSSVDVPQQLPTLGNGDTSL